MKTSTKLLFIFFLSIPVSLWAYNALLKQQLNAGNLVMQLRPDPNQSYNKKQLPAFKYVVVNGALTLGNGSYKDENWQPKINFGNNDKGGYAISILKQYADLVEQTVVNDTLYISFHKNVKYDTEPYAPYEPFIININAVDLHQFDGSFAQFNFDPTFVPALAFKVNIAGKSKLLLNGIITERLDLAVKDSSEATLNANNINNLYYTIPGKGKLSMDIYTAKHFYPGKIDSLAWMEIRGKGNDVQRYFK